ncbi:MAG TPA: hypothetical protein VGQ28_03010, partial [Thermoanaerobaculia bacterium]|nr:hypothetical protein [Thermoanaerobaculia bacterium]
MRILPAVLLTFASILPAAAAPADRAAEELDIREATFRYQFSHNASGLKERAGAYYLSIADKSGRVDDPPGKLLKRFVGNSPPVKKASESLASPDQGVVDKKTGERGLVFRIGAIRWISDTEVEVSGGCYETGSS